MFFFFKVHCETLVFGHIYSVIINRLTKTDAFQDDANLQKKICVFILKDQKSE